MEDECISSLRGRVRDIILLYCANADQFIVYTCRITLPFFAMEKYLLIKIVRLLQKSELSSV